MADKDTLISLAVLKVNLDANRDYLHSLRPFIDTFLHTQKGKSITDAQAADAIRSEFGLIIPTSTINLILKRYVREKYLTKEKGIFIVSDSIQKPDLVAKKTAASRDLDSVVNSFREFVETTHQRTMLEDEALRLLVGFLSEFSIDCMRTYLRGTALPEVNPSKVDLYLVSRFVRHLHKEQTKTFDLFIVLVKGHMQANALLCKEASRLQKSFSGLSIYIDTPVVIALLGLDDESREASLISTINLAKKLDADICVFEHTVQETDAVLASTAANFRKHPHSFNRIEETLRRRGCGVSELLLVAADLKALLRKHGVSIKKTPDYATAFQIDERALESEIGEHIDYKNEKAIIYDVNSIRSIFCLRAGRAPQYLEDAAAVLVTTNSSLANAAYKFGRDSERTSNISSVITDFSLANIAWLKKPDLAPSLPEKEILAFCYAATEPSEILWVKFLDEIDALEKRSLISPSQSAALRVMPAVRDDLMSLTFGEETALTRENILDIAARLESEISKPIIDKHEKALAIKNAEISDFHRKSDALNIERSNLEGRLENAKSAVSKFSKLVSKLISVFILASSTVAATYGVFSGLLPPLLDDGGQIRSWKYFLLAFPLLLILLTMAVTGLSPAALTRNSQSYIERKITLLISKTFRLN